MLPDTHENSRNVCNNTMTLTMVMIWNVPCEQNRFLTMSIYDIMRPNLKRNDHLNMKIQQWVVKKVAKSRHLCLSVDIIFVLPLLLRSLRL